MVILAETWQQSIGIAMAAMILVLVNQWIAPWLANQRQARDLKQHSDKGRTDIKNELSGKIQEGTDSAKLAFTEANELNRKIADTRAMVELINLDGTKKSTESFVLMNNRFDGLDKRLKGIELSLLHLNDIRPPKKDPPNV